MFLITPGALFRRPLSDSGRDTISPFPTERVLIPCLEIVSCITLTSMSKLNEFGDYGAYGVHVAHLASRSQGDICASGLVSAAFLAIRENWSTW